MAYPKKNQADPAYRKLLADLKAGAAGRLYIFHGEESYLKNHCLTQLREALCGGLEAFNAVFLPGERLGLDQLVDAIDTLPMGGGRKLVVVRDYKLMQPAGELKEALPRLLAQLPEYVCLVFDFDTLEFKPDKRLGIWKAVEAHGSVVCFDRAPAGELIPWLKRRFFAQGKGIETPECERLLFLCGHSMTNLITEVDKIASGTPGDRVGAADIDALASRVLEADVFDLTGCVTDGRYDRALFILGDLLAMRHEPVAILAALARQLQRLYGARLALDAGKGESYVAELAGYRSAYPARLLMGGARKLGLEFLRRAQHLCLACDIQLKSNNADGRRSLELLLLQLAREARP